MILNGNQKPQTEERQTKQFSTKQVKKQKGDTRTLQKEKPQIEQQEHNKDNRG